MHFVSFILSLHNCVSNTTLHFWRVVQPQGRKVTTIEVNLNQQKMRADMSDRAQRIEVFNDTQDWIKNDPALSASIPVAKKNTTVFYEDDYPAFDSSKTRDTVITVSGDRSNQAAMKLHRENPDAKIAVMNFANAFHAGGGVTTGASAQEE